jgi:hypothetical protein
MAKVVSRRPLTVVTRGRARVNPYGICGDEVALGQDFLQVFRFSLVTVIPP